MADAEEGDACTLAVRMATGDALSDDQIREELVEPMLERVRQLTAQAGGMDGAAAIDQAAVEMARQKLAAAMFDAKTKYLTDKADAYRRPEIARRLEGMRPVATGQSYMIGTEDRAYSSANSTELDAVQRGDELAQPLVDAVDQVPGLLQRMSSTVMMRGEKGFALDVATEVARLNGDSSVAGGPGDDPKGQQISHLARAIQATLETTRVEQNRAGANNERYPGYIGRLQHDPVLVGGGFWVHQQAAWKQMVERVRALGLGDEETKARLQKLDLRKAQVEAEKMGFQPWDDFLMGKDRGAFQPRVHERTWADAAWEDLPEPTGENDYTGPDKRTEDTAAWSRAERSATARAQAMKLHLAGILRSANDPRELMFYRMWQHITSGRTEVLRGAGDEKDFVPTGGNLGQRISKSKSIHWNSVADEMEYRAKYSRTPYFQSVLGQAQRAGRNIALMERFGPNIERGFGDMQQQLAEAAITTAEKKLVMGSALQAPWEMLNGSANIPVSLRHAEIWRNLRSATAAMKLGSVLLSKPADFAFAAQNNMRAGASMMRAHGLNIESLLSLPNAETRAAARALGAGLRNLQGRLTTQTAGDARPGMFSRAAAQGYRFSGFTFLNKAIETMEVTSQQSLLGEFAERRYDDLPKDVRARLDDFGILEHHWDLVRQARAITGEDGAKYFALDPLDELAAERPELEQQVYQTKALFKAYYMQGMRMALNEPGLRQAMAARAPGATLGLSGPVLRVGSIQGEMATSMLQFKGFVNAAFTRHLVPAVGAAFRGDVGPIANLIVTMTLAGWVGMQLKAISRGEDPRMPTSPGDAAKIVLASMAQGGGLGLYGDFLFGEMDRNNAKFGLASLAGPMAGTSEQVLSILQQAVRGGGIAESTGRSVIPGELVHLGAQNIPVVNTWYTRLALDYLVLWRMEEWASPGYLARYQQSMERKNGVHYWLGPETPSPYH
jgi:hypothetical protein